MAKRDKIAAEIVPFAFGGGPESAYRLAPALRRAAFITLAATAISETLVVLIYAFVETDRIWFHLISTLIITVVAAFPLAMYFSAQRFRLNAALEKLDRDVKYDGLSGLFTRKVFEAQARLLLDQPENSQASILYIDADHFKALNDAFGHDVGDRAIEIIGRSIADKLGPGNIAGRMGGEEFCALLTGQTEQGALVTAERMARAIRVGCEELGVDRTISVSIGLASRRPGEAFDELKKRSDQALYQAKNSGRDRVVCCKGNDGVAAAAAGVAQTAVAGSG